MVQWKPRGTGNIGKATQPFTTQEMMGGGGGSGGGGANASNLQARIRQLVYDRSLAQKRGEDVKSENYSGIRNELKQLRTLLRHKE